MNFIPIKKQLLRASILTLWPKAAYYNNAIADKLKKHYFMANSYESALKIIL
jgi:hypothetical protein